jgi:ATP-dependent DNA helicase DinG
MRDKANTRLGRWAVIDIETTGADQSYDQIIDIGFLLYEGTRLVERFSSLVKSDHELSFFIQKLTGITPKMLKNAPLWDDVLENLELLEGAKLVAHNAEFERSFLEDELYMFSSSPEFEDSLPFLALLFPYKKGLKLEQFIVDWGIADSECHRGLEDSIDLLKVLIIAIRLVREDRTRYQELKSLFLKHGLKDYWFFKFYDLMDDELEELAETIDFDWEKVFYKAREFESLGKQEPIIEESGFPLGFSGENIQTILRDEEKVKEVIPLYRYREGQEKLSLKVGQSFKNRVHALVQAPTGTGKTLGYLIPSALFSLEEQKQVLIATGTKTLQNQAMEKDIPQLRKLLGLDSERLKIRRLVGSQNHLCELLFRQQAEDLLNQGEDFESRFTQLYFDLVFRHNAESSSFDWVLRDDLPYFFKMRMPTFRAQGDSIAVDFRSCTGNRCPFSSECTYIRGLREAKDADIIVGNHSLMFSWPRGFPRPENIVVDEAHKIEEETTKAFTYEATEDQLESFSRSLSNLQGIGSLFYLLAQNEEEAGDSTPLINQLRQETLSTHQMLEDHLRGLPELLEQYFKKHPRYTDQFWNELPFVDDKGPLDETGQAIYNHLKSVQFILKSYSNLLLPYVTRFEAKNFVDEQMIVAITRFETFWGQLDDILLALESCLEKKRGRTHSLFFHQRDGYAIASAPIDVGMVLHDHLLQTSASVVMTSATLANAEGDQGSRGIEWATGYAYLEPERRFKSGFYLPSTYDYKNRSRVYLCDDVPAFYQAEFIPRVLKPVMELIKELGGRTLLLFSARKRFEAARELLIKEFEGIMPIFVQGMGSRVVEDFKEKGEGILIGMESFGEGIDIPGEALEFVFIDKIPDLRMDLVINKRRQFFDSHIGNEFNDYYLAHRSRGLHQKLGRLIRRESDRGGNHCGGFKDSQMEGENI